MTRPRRGTADRGRRIAGRVVAVALGMLVAVAAPAYAYWTATSTGQYARSQASTLPTPVLTAGSVTATSVALSWTQPFAPTGYTLAQSAGTLAGCSASPMTPSLGCTATALTPNTTYTWTLTAERGSWVVLATVSATTSAQVPTTTTLGSLSPTSEAVGTTFSATATVTAGSGHGAPAGSVVFSLFPTSTCTGPAAFTSSAQALATGTATGSLTPVVGTYYWQATYTPSDTATLPSTSGCSSAVTVTPTSTISLDYTNILPADWQGAHPTAVTLGLAVDNRGGTLPQTLTSFTATMTLPDSRASGAAPTSLSGSGWSYSGAAHVGSAWVYTFTWTGTLPHWASTPDLTTTVPFSKTGAGPVPVSVSVWSSYSNTITTTRTIYL